MQAHQYRMFQWVSTTLTTQYVVVLYVRWLEHRVVEEVSNPGKCIQELLLKYLVVVGVVVAPVVVDVLAVVTAVCTLHL